MKEMPRMWFRIPLSDLLSAVKGLTERETDILRLRFLYEYSYREIAQIVGVTEANARQIALRTCSKLRIALNGEVTGK